VWPPLDDFPRQDRNSKKGLDELGLCRFQAGIRPGEFLYPTVQLPQEGAFFQAVAHDHQQRFVLPRLFEVLVQADRVDRWILAEGCGRDGDVELARFCCIARGSASELAYQLLLSRDLKLSQPMTMNNLSSRPPKSNACRRCLFRNRLLKAEGARSPTQHIGADGKQAPICGVFA
jgi:hypothetical protein